MIGPGDLIALVTFEGAVYPNLAITRERLGKPQQAPHALAAALTHWLRRRDLWLEVRGRQIHGIATARALAGPDAWQIDTLIDAGDGDGAVLGALLAQAEEEALRAEVRMLLLRMPAAFGDAVAEVRAHGFDPLLAERLWRAPTAGRLPSPARESSLDVREAVESDWFGRYQLCHGLLPAAARRVLAPTHEQWRAMLERQWLGRRPRETVALEGGRIAGCLSLGRCQGGAQLELQAASSEAAAALLRNAQPRLTAGEPLFALTPAGSTAAERALAGAGFELQEEYVLLGRRLTQPVEEAVPATVGVAAPAGG